MTTIGNITFAPGHPDPKGCKPVSFVSAEEHESLLDRLTTLEREILTLKDQMKVAASLIKKGY